MNDSPVKTYNGIPVPAGETIQFVNGKPITPNHPIIPFIEGDGIGPEISDANRLVLDAAVSLAYGDALGASTGLKSSLATRPRQQFGKALPDDTLAALRHFGVSIKGPLNTPTGGGMRSLNVTMRQHFDLYSCVRPVRYFSGVPSVVKRPQDLDVVIFRENAEDVYAGIEFDPWARHLAKKILALLAEEGYDMCARIPASASRSCRALELVGSFVRQFSLPSNSSARW
jgi:isocitrate dehydrogenase